MRSVRVGVVGSAPGRAVGAFFERRADGRLVLKEVIPAPADAAAKPHARASKGWGRALAAFFERPRRSPGWIIGLTSSVAVVRRVGMPALPHAQREKLLAFEAGQLIAAPPQDLVWAPARMSAAPVGPEWLALGVARREALERIARDQAAAGRPVERLEPRCLAVYRSFHYNYPEWTEGVVLIIDLGPEGRGFSVLLADENSFATRSALTVSGEKGGTAPVWKLADAAASASLAERIHLEVARLRAAHDTGRADEPRVMLQRVFLSGDPVACAAVAGRLAQRLALPVERLDPFRRVDNPAGIPVDEVQDHAAEWVGLAALPSPRCPVLDLSPPLVRTDRERRHRRPYLRAALIALLVAPLPPACLALREIARELREADRLGSDLTRLSPIAAQLKAKRDEAARLREDAARWRAVCEARTQWIAFLDDLQGRIAMDGDLWLERLERRPSDGKSGAMSFRMLRLAGGLLTTAPEAEGGSTESRDRIEIVFERLKQSPWIDGIDHEQFNLTSDNGLRFEAVFTLAENRLP